MFIIKQSKISICPKLKEKLNSKFKKWNQLTFVIFCTQNESIINDNIEDNKADKIQPVLSEKFIEDLK